MTGFGNAEASCDKFSVKAEIKALNGKYLELSTRLPKFLNEWELPLRQHFQKRLNRGTIQFSIFLEKNASGVEAQKLNTELANHYYREFSAFCNEHQLPQNDLFRSILMQPDILRSEEVRFDENDWQVVIQACEEAYKKFDQFRLSEGQTTAEELLQMLEKIQKYLLELATYEEERIQSVRDRIARSMDKLGLAEEPDQNRFEQEMIYYLEKLDISEEKSRLLAHLEHFRNSMDQPYSGKVLGFIAQEIGREINTIGSKSNHAEMQKLVVAMKDELEKIKEQVLNIL